MFRVWTLWIYPARSLALLVAVNIEFVPNVEHSKMWSEPDECALGADFRVIDSTFYFPETLLLSHYGG
jgi:hypothetical protein